MPGKMQPVSSGEEDEYVVEQVSETTTQEMWRSMTQWKICKIKLLCNFVLFSYLAISLSVAFPSNHLLCFYFSELFSSIMEK